MVAKCMTQGNSEQREVSQFSTVTTLRCRSHRPDVLREGDIPKGIKSLVNENSGHIYHVTCPVNLLVVLLSQTFRPHAQFLGILLDLLDRRDCIIHALGPFAEDRYIQPSCFMLASTRGCGQMLNINRNIQGKHSAQPVSISEAGIDHGYASRRYQSNSLPLQHPAHRIARRAPRQNRRAKTQSYSDRKDELCGVNHVSTSARL